MPKFSKKLVKIRILMDARGKKADGMVIGMLIVKMYHRDYIEFIDVDNFISKEQ